MHRYFRSVIALLVLAVPASAQAATHASLPTVTKTLTAPKAVKRSCPSTHAVAHDAEDLARRVAGDEVEYVIGLPGDGFETEVFFSDLGHEYININAEYTT